MVESHAGEKASFDDEAFQQAGAAIVSSNDIWDADIILKVNAPTPEEIELIKEGTTLISFILPAQNPELLEALSVKKINVLAMDSVPRISRAQALDALSSMANIAGYRAVVEAAHEFSTSLPDKLPQPVRFRPQKCLLLVLASRVWLRLVLPEVLVQLFAHLMFVLK